MASKEQEIYFIGGGGCGESRKIGAGESGLLGYRRVT